MTIHPEYLVTVTKQSVCGLFMSGLSLLWLATPVLTYSAERLPSEASLPGEPRRTVELPAESVVPSDPLSAAQTSPSDDVAKDSAGQPPKQDRTGPSPSDLVLLPSEAEIPGAEKEKQAGGEEPDAQPESPSDSAPSTEPGERDTEQPGKDELGDTPGADRREETEPVGRPPKGLPWLRFNVRGHTATVRAICFTGRGQQFCSGGEDKALFVWSPVPGAGASRTKWAHERTIRWQVQRGPRGRIYAVAAGPDSVAMAGHGAMGSLGEILLVDPTSGVLKRALVGQDEGHRQVVAALAFSPQASPQRLASTDLAGQTNLWEQSPETGRWKAKVLCRTDRERYGDQVASVLAQNRSFVAVAFAGPDRVIVPVYQRQQELVSGGPKICCWELESIDLPTGRRTRLSSQATHYRMVTALAASRDGTKAVSADAFGNMYFWDLTTQTEPRRIAQRAAVVSLAFSNDGKTVMAGTAPSPSFDNQALVQQWNVADVSQPDLVIQHKWPQTVYAIDIAPDNAHFAFAQGNAIQVGRIAAAPRDLQALKGNLRIPLRVAFAREAPYYRIAIGSDPDRSKAFDAVFDLVDVQLEAREDIDPELWIPSGWWQGNWSVRATNQNGQTIYWLYEGNVQRGRLPVDTAMHGPVEAATWIPGRDGQPTAVAVGTSGNNNLYVFRLVRDGVAPLLRQFRGHESAVTALSVSRDARYLASAAADGTVRIWNLQGYQSSDPATDRWGAEFAAEDDRLKIASVREDGPLFFRGLRQGDTVTKLEWVGKDQQIEQADSPEAMTEALRLVDWDTLVVFHYRRGDVPQPSFQMFPAWQPLVSLFVSPERHWAFWTPSGYYDASFEGHKLFGWQINRGVQRLPEFFLAAQLQGNLERPDIMRRLLRSGSLERAFRSARAIPPANQQQVVSNQYRLTPRVVIHSPQSGTTIEGDELQIEASVAVRSGVALVPPKAFANGVIAPQRELVSQRPVEGGTEYTYRWSARLPSDPRIVVQVIAGTQHDTVATETVLVDHIVSTPRKKQRLYVFAAGINDYGDAQIQRLEYAVNNARQLVHVLERDSQSLYVSDATMLLNEQATRSLWSAVTSDYASRLRGQVDPDDVLVFFLSGHGVRDERTNRYYYVTANARYDDVRSERYEDCVSFEDFAQFADVPCRKLVILDTCHSGAIQQPLRQQDLKAALRALENDVVFTLTASEGNQEAVEQREQRMGRFTGRLVEALRGAADGPATGGNEDGVVTLDEAVAYVRRQVVLDSQQDADGIEQFPTAGPIDLLPYVRLPLTSIGDAVTGP